MDKLEQSIFFQNSTLHFKNEERNHQFDHYLQNYQNLRSSCKQKYLCPVFSKVDIIIMKIQQGESNIIRINTPKKRGSYAKHNYETRVKLIQMLQQGIKFRQCYQKLSISRTTAISILKKFRQKGEIFEEKGNRSKMQKLQRKSKKKQLSKAENSEQGDHEVSPIGIEEVDGNDRALLLRGEDEPRNLFEEEWSGMAAVYHAWRVANANYVIYVMYAIYGFLPHRILTP